MLRVQFSCQNTNRHKVNTARNYLSILACCALLGSLHAALSVRITARTCEQVCTKLLTKCNILAMENAHRMKAYNFSCNVHHYSYSSVYPMHSIRPILRCTLCIQFCFSYHLPYAFHQTSPAMYTMYPILLLLPLSYSFHQTCPPRYTVYPIMLLLPFTLCIPLDLSSDVHHVSNSASLTIYPMHSIRPILRCTPCIQFCFSYYLPYAFHQTYPPMYTMYPIMLLLQFTLCILSELSTDLHSSRMCCCVSW